jgi:tetratricopeptide (TPR) repeat protein
VRTTTILGTLVLLGLAGCGGDPEPQPEPRADGPASRPATDAASGAPGDPRAAEVEDHWRRGMQSLNEGDLHEAVQAFDRSIELAPDHAHAIASRAIARRYLGEPDAAIEDVTRAIELTKEPAFLLDLLEFRGTVYTRDLGKFVEGEKDLTRVIEGGKDDAELRLYRAICRFEAGDLDGSMADVQKALEMTPNDGAKAVLFQMRGRVKEKKGDLAGARADLERSVAMGNEDAQEDLQKVREQQGR